MSKRNIVLAVLGLCILAVLILTNFGRNLPFLPFGDPVFTEVIPESRPKRLDRRKLARFEGQEIDDILAALAAEQASYPDPNAAKEGETPEEMLLLSLPDAPIPFPEDAEPRDEKRLRDFVTSRQKSESEEPSEDELWQFNLALDALQIGPAQIPETLLRDTSPEPEVDTLSVEFASTREDLSGPFAIGDFDGEPGLEILDSGGARLGRLGGAGDYSPIEDHLVLFPGNGVYPCDRDGDGDLDVYLTRGAGFPDSLLRNDGGKFTDVTIETGLLAFRDTTSAAWLDYNGDGLPDLLVGSSDQPLELYHQTEGGAFQPVAWDLSLWVPRGIRSIEVGDITGDGAPDAFLGIDGLPDRLCANRPAAEWDDWQFEDISATIGLEDSVESEAMFHDFDNDGKTDLLLGAIDGGDKSRVRLFQNQEEGEFREVTSEVGLGGIRKFTTAGTIDIDNDGFDEILIGTPTLSMNRVFWNRGGVEFRELTVASRGGFLDEPIHCASGDLDGDGADDLLYRDRFGNTRRMEASGDLHPWVGVRFSESAPGSRVSVLVRDPDWILHSIEKLIGSEREITIGIGETDSIEKLEVFLPGEESPLHTLENLKPNRVIAVDLPTRPRKRPVIDFENGVLKVDREAEKTPSKSG